MITLKLDPFDIFYHLKVNNNTLKIIIIPNSVLLIEPIDMPFICLIDHISDVEELNNKIKEFICSVKQEWIKRHLKDKQKHLDYIKKLQNS